MLAHRTHILRCAPEQVRPATSDEKALVETPETQLLGVKDMLEGGTFRSSQYVDLLAQAYPPVEDEVLQQALEQPSPAAEGPSSELPDIDPLPAVLPNEAGSDSVPQQQSG